MGRTAKIEDAVVEQNTEAQKNGERLIRFKIPIGSSEKERADVFVAVNGKSYLIKRGVLENAEAQREYAIELEEKVRYKE